MTLRQTGAQVRRHLGDLPAARKEAEELSCDPRTDALESITSHHEELGDGARLFVAGHVGRPAHEGEPAWRIEWLPHQRG